MSNTLEKYKEEFLDEYGLNFEKEYFSEKENNELNEIIQTGEQAEVNKILDEYTYDFDTLKNRYIFYKKILSNYSKEDIDQFIQLKILEYSKNTYSGIMTIRTIIIILFVLTLLGILLSWFMQSRQ